MNYSTTLLEKFKAEAAKREGKRGECWMWTKRSAERNTSATFGTRKGRSTDPGDTVYRLSCAAFVEPITDEKPFVLHSCDNPWCWNPEHLRAGTARDNAQDAVSRGRNYLGGPHEYARGEKIHLAKLTEESVREIRQAHAQGASQVDLGKQYNVTQATISGVVRRKTWQHVN